MLAIGGGIVAGYMREDGAREVFADPAHADGARRRTGRRGPRTTDGVRVSGRWRFASGVTHATGWSLGCIVMKDGQPNMTPHGPEIVHVFVPTKDVQIHDTWHVSGLCGTGSNDVSCENVFVPTRRVFSLFDPTGFRPEPLYQMPVLTHGRARDLGRRARHRAAPRSTR